MEIISSGRGEIKIGGEEHRDQIRRAVREKKALVRKIYWLALIMIGLPSLMIGFAICHLSN